MDLRQRTLENYIAVNGKKPFRDWLTNLHENIQAQIRKRLYRLGMGDFGDCKNIGDGVFELRFHFGAGYRIYFGSESDRLIILLMGGDKSSQSKDIKKALEYWHDYKKRKISGH